MGPAKEDRERHRGGRRPLKVKKVDNAKGRSHGQGRRSILFSRGEEGITERIPTPRRIKRKRILARDEDYGRIRGTKRMNEARSLRRNRGSSIIRGVGRVSGGGQQYFLARSTEEQGARGNQKDHP